MPARTPRPPRPSKVQRTAFQSEGMRIFRAQRTAESLLSRVSAERGSVMSLSRDELKALADELSHVSQIASTYHLEKAQVGSLAPEVFPEPAA